LSPVYRWQTRQVARHFCADCGCATFSDSLAFESDGKWDGSTRRIGVNARLFDDFDAAPASTNKAAPAWNHAFLRQFMKPSAAVPPRAP
jgi:hypothetical protein